MQHDRCRREREHHADGHCDTPRLPHRHRNTHNNRYGNADLQTTQAKQLVPHPPQQARLKLQPNQEQHHDNAELGEVLDADHIDMQLLKQRTDRDTGKQVAEHRAKSKT